MVKAEGDFAAEQVDAEAASHQASVDRELTRLKAELGFTATSKKAELDHELAVLKSGLQSESRRLQAELDATYGALSRLRNATGALRLELFLSTRSVIGRLQMFSRDQYEFDAEDSSREGPYHDCGLLIYRLLRPIVVSSLIEPTMYFRDLSLDKVAMDFLDFNHTATEMLTGERIGYFPNGDPGVGLRDGGDRTAEKHPDFDMKNCWLARSPDHAAASGPRSFPFQRRRSSYLKSAADALLLGPATGESSGDIHRKVCMGHAEFLERWEDQDRFEDWHVKIDSMKHFMHQFGFGPEDDAIAWLRLVGYSYVCKWFFDREPDRAIIEDPEWRKHFRVPLNIEQMIETGGDNSLIRHSAMYPRYLDQIIEDAL